MVKTNVHFPTDINLLFDAIRKAIELIAQLCERHTKSDWRQSVYNLRQIKKSYRKAQQSKKSGGKDKIDREKKSRDAHQTYIDCCVSYLDRVNDTIKRFDTKVLSFVDTTLLQSVKNFICHAQRQIDQTRRRVIIGEKIPHDEKVFSLFEPHTEWIVKGKQGVPVELGIKVCILEDQHQFILHHQVMQKTTDEKITVAMAEASKKRFSTLYSVSYDRGFFTKENREKLQTQLDAVSLPKKGKRSDIDKSIETSADYLLAKKKHSAVESAINALDEHGLDKCPDHGIDRFARYVALAIVARNIQRVGAILQKKDYRLFVLRERREKLKAA